MKKNLAIFDDNELYMEHLLYYLKNKGEMPFTTVAFTSEDKLMEFAERETVDYLLVSESKRVSMGVNTKVIELSEDKKQGCLYRYTPAAELRKNILALFGEEENYVDFDGSKTRFIGVYSPVSRCCKTTFCEILGELLAKKYRVLYLNFESFAGFSMKGCLREHDNLSDLMYYFNNLHDQFYRKFNESIENVGGVDMISPAYYYLDLSYLSAKQWKEFLEELSLMNEYDYIIMDLSDYLNGLLDVFLPACRIVYTLTGGDKAAQSKIMHYERVLEEYNHADILEKTRKIGIPIFKNLPDSPERLIFSELAEYITKQTKEDFDW